MSTDKFMASFFAGILIILTCFATFMALNASLGEETITHKLGTSSIINEDSIEYYMLFYRTSDIDSWIDTSHTTTIEIPITKNHYEFLNQEINK